VPDDLYSAHAPAIEAVLASVCRVHRLPPDQADEFASWARLRLLDQDQRILRQFGGRSSLRTFLVTVLERLFLDWRNHEWGKWRPSSEARRLGDVAIELERLVLRDRCTLDEAAQILVTRGTARSIADCEQAWARLPRQARRQRVDEESLATVPAPSAVDDPVEEAQRRQAEASVLAALERALASLPPADQVLLRMRFWSGEKVSRIAALTGEDQKGLYRRFDRLALHLRERLLAEGIGLEVLADLWGRFQFPADEPGGADAQAS
jgi:RNA polymerase sigma factor (sigma-70 family)